MYDEILSAVKALAKLHSAPFTEIGSGSLPTENGLSMYIGAGAPLEQHLDRGGIFDASIVLNGKHSNLQILLHALSGIHYELSISTDYPRGERWQITDIVTSAAPNYVDRELSNSKQWLYGSILKVTFYVQGGN